MSTPLNSDSSVTEQDRDLISDDLMCLACGYNLRALNRSASCPECGLSIQHTVIARQGMTRRELAALAFRVVAFWFFLNTAVELIQVSQFLYGDWIRLSLSGLLTVAVFTLLAVFWWKAEVPARLAIKNDGPISLSGRLVLTEVMSVALSIIGVIYVIYAFVGTAWILTSSFIDINNQYVRTSVVRVVINLFVGCVLLMGTRRLSESLIRLRTAGTRNIRSTPDD